MCSVFTEPVASLGQGTVRHAVQGSEVWGGVGSLWYAEKGAVREAYTGLKKENSQRC